MLIITMAERIQKLMSAAGIGSRRESESMIAAGRVTVNGRVASLGEKADPATDDIRVDGRRLRSDKRVYIKLHKPKGVISSTEDELNAGRKTIRDLVDLPGFLYPVGRLDKQSEGLVLMTNDGKLAHRLTHPRYEHTKVYEVQVEGHPSDEMLELWRRGVMLDGRLTAPAIIEIMERSKNSTRLRITLKEGRKRQIRRIAASIGHPAARLLRTEIGPIKLGTLKAGEWQRLDTKELSGLMREVYGDD